MLLLLLLFRKQFVAPLLLLPVPFSVLSVFLLTFYLMAFVFVLYPFLTEVSKVPGYSFSDFIFVAKCVTVFRCSSNEASKPSTPNFCDVCHNVFIRAVLHLRVVCQILQVGSNFGIYELLDAGLGSKSEDIFR